MSQISCVVCASAPSLHYFASPDRFAFLFCQPISQSVQNSNSLCEQQSQVKMNLFGDLFGQRGDYSNGAFYAGHRKYLNNLEANSSFEPPKEFKSKRHNLRESHKHNQHEDHNKVGFHINFQKKLQDTPDEEQNKNKFKKVANLIKTTVILEHFSSMSRNDWVVDLQAGCRIWINKNTGEVVSTCPWQHDDHHDVGDHSTGNSARRDSAGSASLHHQSSYAPGHSSVGSVGSHGSHMS